MPLTIAGDESTLLPAAALNRCTRVDTLDTEMALSPGLSPPWAGPNLNSGHQSLGADSATEAAAIGTETLVSLSPRPPGMRA